MPFLLSNILQPCPTDPQATLGPSSGKDMMSLHHAMGSGAMAMAMVTGSSWMCRCRCLGCPLGALGRLGSLRALLRSAHPNGNPYDMAIIMYAYIYICVCVTV